MSDFLSRYSATRTLGATGRELAEGVMGSARGEIRVHADERADQITRAFGAKAMTIGRDLFFRSGHFDPDSRAGRRLLQHELTHARMAGPLSKRAFFWDGGLHEKLTTARAVGQILKSGIPESKTIARELPAASKKMDECCGGTNPNHGEGTLHYYVFDVGTALSMVAANVERQNFYRDEAAADFRKWVLLNKYSSSGDKRAASRQIRSAKKQFMASVIRNFGHMLHVAQDRAAHGEGASPRRGHGIGGINGDGCDRAATNPAGWKIAEARTTAVTSDLLSKFAGSLR